MENLTIRKAVPEDAPVIAGFQMDMARETEGVILEENVVQRGVNAVFEDPSRGFYHVAELDGAIVACHLVTLEWSDWRDANIYWIQSLYVVPSRRNEGIFKLMYRALKDKVLASPEIKGIRLYVDKRNRPAGEVYRKLGMDSEHYDLFEWMKG